jgi:hypothetical protein
MRLADHQVVRPGLGVKYAARIRHVSCQGLFDQDVLAGSQCARAGRDMQFVGQGDRYRVDPVHDLVEAAIPLYAHFRLDGLQAISRDIDDANHFDIAHGLQDAGVQRAHQPHAYYGNTYHSVVFLWFPGWPVLGPARSVSRRGHSPLVTSRPSRRPLVPPMDVQPLFPCSAHLPQARTRMSCNRLPSQVSTFAKPTFLSQPARASCLSTENAA